MTNNEIIQNAVESAFTPSQLEQLAASIYTPEQIAARRSCIVAVMEEAAEGGADPILTEMVAEAFHTFQEWKRMGYSVKKGAKSALCCWLWKYTDKPGRATKAAAAEAGQDAPEHDPHFYKAKSYLFNSLQVEPSRA